MFTLFPADHRREHHEPGALSQGLHPVYDLVDGLAANLLAALGAVGDAHPGPEQTQIVVDLRHRANGGAGALGGGLLVNGNGRGQAVDGIHIRLIHLPQKLPGIGAQALHIPPLALGIDGIEGQTGLSRTAEAGKDHHFVSWNLQIHIFQIIFPGTPDNDLIVHSLPRFCCICKPAFRRNFCRLAIIPHSFLFHNPFSNENSHLSFSHLHGSGIDTSFQIVWRCP